MFFANELEKGNILASGITTLINFIKTKSETEDSFF